MYKTAADSYPDLTPRFKAHQSKKNPFCLIKKAKWQVLASVLPNLNQNATGELEKVWKFERVNCDAPYPWRGLIISSPTATRISHIITPRPKLFMINSNWLLLKLINYI